MSDSYFPRLHPLEATGHSPSETADEEVERLSNELRACESERDAAHDAVAEAALLLAAEKAEHRKTLGRLGEANRLLEVERRAGELMRGELADLRWHNCLIRAERGEGGHDS